MKKILIFGLMIVSLLFVSMVSAYSFRGSFVPFDDDFCKIENSKFSYWMNPERNQGQGWLSINMRCEEELIRFHLKLKLTEIIFEDDWGYVTENSYRGIVWQKGYTPIIIPEEQKLFLALYKSGDKVYLEDMEIKGRLVFN